MKLGAWLAILLFGLARLSGCAAKPIALSPDDRLHVIAVNEKGESVDPPNWPAVESVEQFDNQLDQLFAAMDAYHAARRAAHPNEPNRIMLFVHGGLTNPRESVSYAERKTQAIEDAGYFPIFIVWNPDLGSSYAEHLTKVRQGEYEEHSAWLAPFYLVADLGRAAARLPITWAFQFGSDFNRETAAVSSIRNDNAELRWLDNPQFEPAIVITDELIRRYKSGPTTQMAVSLGPVKGDPSEAADSVGTYLLSLPLKFACSPILDGAGSAAWDNMYRRANVLFDGFSAADLKIKPGDASEILNPGDGAIERLLHRLKDKKPADSPYQITLIGHSMGSIVLNELVRRSIDLDIQYKQIIYMAAACSIRDFQRSVVPYLERHHETRFYNLCLHPVNELRERHAWDIVPRGSLLVWIDDMFSDPHTPIDRTLGRWENVVATSFVIPQDIRRQVSLKAFACYLSGAVPSDVPQMHGDFSQMPFWKPSFWRADSAEIASGNIAPMRRKLDALRLREHHLPASRPATHAR